MIRKWLSRFVAKEVSGLSSPARWLRDVFGSEETHAGIEVSAENALTCSTVAACVRLLSESVASLPLHVYRRAGESKAKTPDHSLYPLLHNAPNELQTAYTWRQQLVANVLLRGNAYSIIERADDGAVRALWPVPSNSITLEAADGRLVYHHHAREKRSYEHWDVLHFRGPSLDGLIGLSVISMARQGIGLAMAQDLYGASLFKNRARPGLVVKSPSVVGPDEREAMKEWLKQFEGALNAGKSFLLENGWDLATVGFSAEDSQFLESRQFSVQEICRWFRVPPHMVGDPTRLAYASSEAEMLSFISHTLRPWLVAIESELNHKLFRRSHFAEFDANALARGDQAARYESYSKGLAAGFLTVADVRRWENLPELPDTDKLLRPANMLPAGEVPNNAVVN